MLIDKSINKPYNETHKQGVRNRKNNLIKIILLITFVIGYAGIIGGITLHFIYNNQFDLFIAGVLSIVGIVVSFCNLKEN